MSRDAKQTKRAFRRAHRHGESMKDWARRVADLNAEVTCPGYVIRWAQEKGLL